MGRHPRATFDRYAAAALAGVDIAEIDDRLDELVDAYLLETPTAGRYRLHDLVHDYAAALLAAEPPERDAAVIQRLLAHYLHAAAAATAHYERAAARTTLPLDEPPPPTVPPFADTGQAVTWLESTWLNVVAAVELTDAAGHDGYTWRLGRVALRRVGEVGNPYERAKAHDGIATALHEVDPANAYEHWWKALEIYGDMDVPEATEVRRRLARLERSRRSAV